MLIGTRPVFLLSKQAAKGQVFTVANFDIVNPVYVSAEKSFTSITSDAIAIPPLGSMPISGDIDTYAVSTIAAGVSIGVMPGSGGWSPSPAQISAQINALGLAKDTSVNGVVANTSATATSVSTVATNTTGVAKDTSVNGVLGNTSTTATNTGATTTAVGNVPTGIFNTGVPLAHKNTSLLNTTNTTIVASANTQIGGTLSFTQHSFEMRLKFGWNTLNGSNGLCVITIQWIDSGSALLTAVDQYVSVIASTTDATNFFTRIVGPTKADTAKLFIQNLDVAQTMTCSALVLAHSRAFTGDSLDVPLLGPTSVTVAGAIGASGDSRYLLGAQNNALGVGATDTWLCTPSVGPIWVNVFETGVAGANIAVKLRMTPNSFYSTSGNGCWLFNDLMGAGNPNKFALSVFQSGGPMIFQITNNGSVGANYSVSITRQQALQ